MYIHGNNSGSYCVQFIMLFIPCKLGAAIHRPPVIVRGCDSEEGNMHMGTVRTERTS
jgi:hypothetical protein